MLTVFLLLLLFISAGILISSIIRDRKIIHDPAFSFEDENSEKASRVWWEKRRIRYNVSQLISGLLAFIIYAVLGYRLIPDFEITLFTLLYLGICYLFMMAVANFFYNLGYMIEQRYAPQVSPARFRQQLFNAGFWFSVSLPFLVPALVVLQYLLT